MNKIYQSALWYQYVTMVQNILTIMANSDSDCFDDSQKHNIVDEAENIIHIIRKHEDI